MDRGDATARLRGSGGEGDTSSCCIFSSRRPRQTVTPVLCSKRQPERKVFFCDLTCTISWKNIPVTWISQVKVKGVSARVNSESEISQFQMCSEISQGGEHCTKKSERPKPLPSPQLVKHQNTKRVVLPWPQRNPKWTRGVEDVSLFERGPLCRRSAGLAACLRLSAPLRRDRQAQGRRALGDVWSSVCAVWNGSGQYRTNRCGGRKATDTWHNTVQGTALMFLQPSRSVTWTKRRRDAAFKPRTFQISERRKKFLLCLSYFSECTSFFDTNPERTFFSSCPDKERNSSRTWECAWRARI